MPQNHKESSKQDRFSEQKNEIAGVFLIGLAALAFAAIFFNGAGFVGEIIKSGIYLLFGKRGAFIPVIGMAFAGGMLIGSKRIICLNRRFFAVFLLLLCTLVIIHLASAVPLTGDSWEVASSGAGVLGHALSVWLLAWFGKVGIVVFLITIIIVAFILAMEQPLFKTLKIWWQKQKNLSTANTKKTLSEPSGVQQQASAIDEPDIPLEVPLTDQVTDTAKPDPKSSNVIAALQTMLKDKEKPSRPKKAVTEEIKDEELPSFTQTPEQSGPYQLPDIELIESRGKVKKTGRSADQSRQLEETLAQFGVQAKVIEVHHGPVITRYDLQPAPGVKVSRIVNLTDDLALALAARGLRLEAPIPGKSAIGIEVPNKESQIVSFRDMLESKVFWETGKLSVALGMDIAGEVVMADLGKMPHLLVAGATGSGKSVCVNTIIMSILFKAFPNEVKFIMIDPKMVELSMYNGIPHLMAPVVTEAKKAAGVLKLVVDEMERRYKMFAEARVRELDKYNAQLPEGEEPLPYIVVIIDELADLMMVAPVEVEDSICRIAQMARATGIHLVIATQRPSVDVITGLIKANVPSRIAFAVSSQIDSRTILDAVGAERLLGRGDMLFSPVGSMKPRRVQGALVVDKDIEAVIEHWKNQGQPEYQEKFINIPDRAERIMDEEEDDLFWDAVRIVVEHGQASASILQRRLRIGYTRAARLVDMMEAKGLIGAYEGSKPREVYITARQMEELRSKSQN
ncbi:MAG TPA: DNA translocase FtsK [Bacillota bacterium]|nr:DNA translocase FtsK [Bacillota bacterium]HPT87517.1 DNA translocase FtsK [Bacillota bacterium]